MSDTKTKVAGKSRFAEKRQDPEFRQAYLEERGRLDFSEALLELMDKLDVSQAELSRRLGVSPSTVSRLLTTGHLPRLDSLMRVLDALQVRMEVKLEAQSPAGQRSRTIRSEVSYVPEEYHESGR